MLILGNTFKSLSIRKKFCLKFPSRSSSWHFSVRFFTIQFPAAIYRPSHTAVVPAKNQLLSMHETMFLHNRNDFFKQRSSQKKIYKNLCSLSCKCPYILQLKLLEKLLQLWEKNVVCSEDHCFLQLQGLETQFHNCINFFTFLRA